MVATEPVADTPHLWRWLGLAVGLVAVLAWWGGRDETPGGAEPVRAYSSPLGPTPELPARAEVTWAATTAVEQTSALPPSVACHGPAFDLLVEGRVHAQCIAPMRAVQNGSLRSHRAEASEDGLRWLQIDTAGDELVSVTVGRQGAAEFGCEGAACTGITLGEAGLRGERTFVLDSLQLTRLAEASDALTDSNTLISARLTSRPAADSPDTDACAAPSVVVTSSAAAAGRGFCAQDGLAVERADDGGRIHRFASIDGPTIAVSSSAGGELQRIEYGALACSGAQCAGAELAAAGRDGPLELVLNGTVLTATSGQPGWASLHGRLRAP